MGAPAIIHKKKNAGQDRELALQFLRYMATMREVEDRIERKLYRQGKIVGGVYVGRGQEAIPVGVGLTAEPEDVLCPSHRDLALPGRRPMLGYACRIASIESSESENSSASARRNSSSWLAYGRPRAMSPASTTALQHS